MPAMVAIASLGYVHMEAGVKIIMKNTNTSKEKVKGVDQHEGK